MIRRINERLRPLAIVGLLSLLAIAGLIYSGNRAPSSAEASARAPKVTSDTETHWGYTGFEGPLYWGTAYMPGGNDSNGNYESYELCLKGNAQSPLSATDLNKHEPSAALNIQPATVAGYATDNGHAVALGSTDAGKKLQGNSTLLIGGTFYKLIQLHFHSPSEHRRWVNGSYGSFDPVEMHLVHEGPDGSLAVVGVFITSSGNNSVVNSELAKVQEGMEQANTVTFDVSKAIPSSGWALSYDGSLTIPPCTQAVKWFVMKSTITAAPSQIDWLRSYYSNNSRGASFEKVDGGLKQVSSGEAGVWGVNSSDHLYLRAGVNEGYIRGTAWIALQAYTIKHVSSGPYGAWLVASSSTGNVVLHTTAAKALANSFDHVTPPLANVTRISAGKAGVWAVDKDGRVFYRMGVTESTPTGTGWAPFPTTASTIKIKDIASGEFGVWGVDTDNKLYFLVGSTAGTLANPGASSFYEVDKNISRVSSGLLGVWALEAGGSVSQVIKMRTGITGGNPEGEGWRTQDGLLNEISSGKYGVWGANNSYNVYFLSSAPSYRFCP